MSALIQRVVIGVLTAAVVLAAGQASARDRDKDHDAARSAVERGELRPLADILAGLRGKLPGEVAGVEIERKDGRWVYEFRLVNGKGELFKAYVDGRSGELERIRQR